MILATIISAIFFVVFLLLPKPIGTVTRDNKLVVSPETEDEESQPKITLENQYCKDSHQEDLLDEVKEILSFSFSSRMRALLPICAWSGISIAFYSGILVSLLNHK
jgi:hypothetical protein